MNILFEKTFMNDLEKTRDKHIFKQVKEVIAQAKSAESAAEIQDLNAMQDYKTCHRIKLGEYRIGIQVQMQKLIFVRLIHRKEMYHFFT